ncbi:hypothetical protein [Aquirufa salirivi]|uniref:Uncharacterized protein n=1 Tax=Aquirufa salirivi TaxID=3104729 RepID=A0ABW8RZI2_9BACT
MSEFEESEYRGPLFNQLEKGSHLLWEPGQVFEKTIGIDRASLCLNDYLWELHGHSIILGGSILRGKTLNYIWQGSKPSKILPDFKLNLFIQAKRSTYSSQSNNILKPHINSYYWFFEITPHQQLALEQLEKELSGDAIVIYAAPVFHKQQELYNHTSNQSIIGNSTFPQASMLKGHSKWYYDKAGIIGVANPNLEFFDRENLLSQLEEKRSEAGDFNQYNRIKNLQRLSKAINSVVENSSNDFQASMFAYYSNIIDDKINLFELQETKGLKDFMKIETFNYLWKLNWMTF